MREDYTPRLSNDEADERGRTDACQDEVYAYARKLMDDNGLTSIMDIGTGGGFKLMKYFSDKVTLGTDIEPNLSWVKDKYPDRHWMQSDFSATDMTGSLLVGFDVIICADVIEHLVDPDALLAFIKRCKPKYII